MTQISKFAAQVKNLAAGEFVAENPHPFLLVSGFAGDDAARMFETLPIGSDGNGEPDRPTGEPTVHAIRRTDGSPGMVTVGRARNTAIVLDFAAVSKLHAYFRADGTEAWVVGDAGSSNGTVLNGERLEKNQPKAIQDGDEIVIASRVFCVFLRPETLFTRLQPYF